ncbi:MAG: response regulator [bacterium]|nr:response regulator [bacterium]
MKVHERPASTVRPLAFLVAILALAGAPVVDAGPDAYDAAGDDGPTGFVHRQWTVADGLPVNALTDVAQTSDGWLWIGSFDGLVRFDGSSFTRYDTVAAPALRSNRIVHLIADDEGGLWILTEQGHVTRYAGGVFQAIEVGQGDSPRVVQMALDGCGVLWLATPDGLFRERGGWLVAAPEELAGQAIHAVGAGAEGRLWLATGGNRLASVEAGEVRWTGAGLDDHPRHFVQYLTEGDDGVVWIGTDNGLFQWREGALAVERVVDLESARGVLSAGMVLPPAAAGGGRPAVTWEADRSMLFLRHGSRGGLWESTGNALLHDGRHVLFLPSDGGPGIRALAFDQEGTAWIATGSQGLHALRLARVTNLSEAEGLSHRNVYSIHEGRGGTIWIGDAVGGLTAVRPEDASGDREIETIPVDVPSAGNAALAILDDPISGLLLVGTSDGLYRVDGQRRLPLADVATDPARPALTNGPIRAMVRSRDGRLILGHDLGLWASRPGDPGEDGWLFTRLPESAGWRVRALLEDSEGNLWLGTNGDGVIRWRDGGFTQWTTDDGLPSDLVRALHRDDDGILWIATEDRGLARIDPATLDSMPEIAVIQKRDGLWEDGLHRILEDGGGWFWISTNRGVFRVRRSQLEDFVAGRVARVDSVAYTDDDGMRNREANGGVQDAGIRARDGSLWFPTQDGVAIFRPPALLRIGVPPPVHVGRVRAGEQEIGAIDGTVTLGADQRSFEIGYTALTFRAPERTRFRYRLEGFQRDWTEADDRRRAVFTRVPPGRYDFHVQARSGDGVWNREGARLVVVVRPFFWETWWARGTGFLALLGFAAGGFRLYDHRQRVRQHELEAEVARLMAECDGCRLTVALSQQRDTAEQQAEKLAELERLKSDLFADVSHELRTPLTLTLGPLRDLRDGRCGELPPAALEEVKVASSNAERLLYYVNEILDTAKMESGRFELRVRPGDLTAFLADLVERFESLAERHGLRYRFVPPPVPIPIWGDPGQLDKVFSNLLSNAMRYTPEGGLVEVTVEEPEGAAPGEGSVAVTVRDEGPGIAPEDQERIFDRFARVTGQPTRDGSGTGLGLPLARRLAELHGGSLTVESAPGEGSAFRVELRLGHEHFVPEQVFEDEPWRTADASSGPPLSGLWASDGQPASGDREDRTTVLVVDDHPGIRTFVRRHLESSYRVAEAADGAEGLALARELLPDLVVADVMMPELDGFELCRTLKRDPELDWVPVVLLTARAAADDKLAGLGEGADDYMTKPFDARELKARVDNLIASRRRLRERFAGGNGNGNGMPRPRLPLAPGVRATPDDLEWLKRVREAVEVSFEDESLSVDTLSVDTLAARLAVHRSRLHERLRLLTGSSPQKLITELRLKRAADLLGRETVSVSEAAYAVGYESVSSFSRRFKERFGKSPSVWRRQAVA